MSFGFYKNKKVLITGHTGFKGSWLSLWLTQLGASVCGYSLEPNTNPSLFNILKLEKKLEHHIGDIRDYDRLKNVILNFKPDIIFHLAAQPLVRLSYKIPRETYEINLMGTVNILDIAKKSKTLKAVVNITSDKCYENKEWIWGYRENDPMGGYDPYSSSKGCSELITSAFRNSFFKQLKIGLASARAGNVIGGGDWAEDRLIPDIVRSLSKNEEIIIRSPKAIRPWQHVMEPLSGYLRLGESLYNEPEKYSSAWNFGPKMDEMLTVEEVVKKSIAIWGKGSYQVIKNDEYHEANFLKLDTSKSRFQLKWEPQLNSEKSLEETIIWYKNYYQNSLKLEDSINLLNCFSESS